MLRDAISPSIVKGQLDNEVAWYQPVVEAPAEIEIPDEVEVPVAAVMAEETLADDNVAV